MIPVYIYIFFYLYLSLPGSFCSYQHTSSGVSMEAPVEISTVCEIGEENTSFKGMNSQDMALISLVCIDYSRNAALLYLCLRSSLLKSKQLG